MHKHPHQGLVRWEVHLSDFTTTNALQAATMEKCTTDGAYVVDQAVARKLRACEDRCEVEGLMFIPLAVGTFGG